MKKLIFATLLLGCSTTARLVREEKELKTIGVNAGRYGESLYTRDLRLKAEQICAHGYFKTYEGRKPPTMKGITLDAHDYFWVIKCQ